VYTSRKLLAGLLLALLEAALACAATRVPFVGGNHQRRGLPWVLVGLGRRARGSSREREGSPCVTSPGARPMTGRLVRCGVGTGTLTRLLALGRVVVLPPAPPLYAGSTNIIGAAVSETAMRPNPSARGFPLTETTDADGSSGEALRARLWRASDRTRIYLVPAEFRM
jgi:hypothetical protein